MPATVTALQPPTRPQDPALAATLAELSQLGLAVARVASRLARIEDAALDTLAETTVEAAQALAAPHASLDAALRAGRDADSSEAARQAAIARVAAIAECFDKAARAVRRTVALQARLATGRPFADPPHPGAAPTPHSAPRPRPNGEAERTDRPDTPDDLPAATDGELLGAIRRDLSTAAARLAQTPTTPAPTASVPTTPAHPTPEPLPTPPAPPPPRPGGHPPTCPAPEPPAPPAKPPPGPPG